MREKSWHSFGHDVMDDTHIDHHVPADATPRHHVLECGLPPLLPLLVVTCSPCFCRRIGHGRREQEVPREVHHWPSPVQHVAVTAVTATTDTTRASEAKPLLLLLLFRRAPVHVRQLLLHMSLVRGEWKVISRKWKAILRKEGHV